jgi:hypothetical protein
VPRTCTICTHPKRREIDRALLDAATYRTIADRYGLSETALKRHRKEHVPAELAKAQQAAEVAIADDLLGQVRALRNRAISLLTKAEAAGDYRTALAGIREARACIEVLLEVEGELDRRGVTNIVINAEWIELRTIMLTALQPYPDARQAIAARLRMIEGGSGHAAD